MCSGLGLDVYVNLYTYLKCICMHVKLHILLAAKCSVLINAGLVAEA